MEGCQHGQIEIVKIVLAKGTECRVIKLVSLNDCLCNDYNEMVDKIIHIPVKNGKVIFE